MGYLATDMARIPGGQAFEWYVFLLEDNWQDDLRRELADNFQILAREVGPNVLVVRGVDPVDFFDQVFSTYALGADESDGRRLPALLITDTPPTAINEDRRRLEKARMLVLHLSEHYQERSSVTDLLRKLALTVREPNAFKALQALDKEKIKKYWGWLTSYLELKPSFFGFGVNINAILDDLFIRPRP